MKPSAPQNQQSQLIEITMLLVALAGLAVIAALAVTLAFSAQPAPQADTRNLSTTERAHTVPADDTELTSS